MSVPDPMQDGIYTYRKLDSSRSEIRVLIVEPGWEGPIYCRLEHSDLSKVCYETISYVWGDTNSRATVYIDGLRLDVSASSEAALQRARIGSGERTLWIDAVSINQCDIAERSQQVAIMPKIFSHGVRNLIWLGNGESNTIEQAMRSLQAIVNEMKNASDGFENLASMLYNRYGEFKYSDQAIVSDVDWVAVRDFFDNPWFSRLWVVQEAALAQENVCFCGRYELPLRDVLYVSTWLRFKTYSLPFTRKAHKGLINSAWMAELTDPRCGVIDLPLHWNLLTILKTTRPFLASQPQDHIFSLLGLYQKLRKVKVLPRVLTPNYQTSLAETFIAAARFAINECGGLHILQEGLHRYEDDSTNNDFPTWVPLWHRGLDERHGCYSLLSSFLPFDASGGQRMLQIEVESDESRILEVRGFVLGTISVTLQTILGHGSLEMSTRADEKAWHANYRALIAQDQSYEDIARSLVGDKKWDYMPLEPSDAMSSYSAYITALEDNDECSYEWTGSGQPIEEASIASRYHRAVWNLQHNRRAFRLDNGYMGTGPSILQVGDIAAILYGCRCPVILRTSWNDKLHAHFVGESYIHGVMHGEAVRSHKEQEREDQLFRLV